MPQIFHRSFNTVSKVTIFGAVFLLAALAWVMRTLARSSYVTGAHTALVQPVQFSHEHHAGRLRIDCRFCHNSVEQSSFAGMPSTKTCMTCHHEIWFGSPELEPVRESYRSLQTVAQPIAWQRVHHLAEFAYFDHSIHVRKGIGCSSCHGRVDQMAILYQTETLLMEWCLDCHRDPKPHLRRQRDIYNFDWQGLESEATQQELLQTYGIRSPRELTSCSVCHR